MTKAEILERVKVIVVDQLGVEPEDVSEDAKLVDDLGTDDLDIIEIIMALEGEFDIEIPDEDGPEEKFKAVADVVNYLAERLK